MAETKQDPSSDEFKVQSLLVAVVLIVLGIVFFFFASSIAGGIIALLGAVFGLSSQVGNKDK